jgi:hypothetical protein
MKNKRKFVRARPGWIVLVSSVALLVWSGMAGADIAAASVEQQPSIEASALLTEKLPLAGAGYKVRSPVVVDDFLGKFEIDTDWGLVQARGEELLAIRVGEVAALARLDEIEKSDVFAQALVNSAKSTGQGIVRVVTNPVDTVKGLPSGIGRMFKRTAGTVRAVATSVSDAAKGGDQNGGSGEGGGQDFAKELVGVNKARRTLAKSLGIDPYSGNPLLQSRLEELAWAAMAGGMTMSVVSGAAGSALSTVSRVDSLVWDETPVEIQQGLEKQLVAQGYEAESARAFLRNRWFTPTLQFALVGALDKFQKVEGAAGVLELATRIKSEAHARFLIQQLRMVTAHTTANDSVADLAALENLVVAHLVSGKTLVTMPVDFISWTGEIAEIDADPRPASGSGRIVISGQISALARAELQSRGWQISAGVGRPK